MLNENCLPALNTEIWAIVNKLVVNRDGCTFQGSGYEVRRIVVKEVAYGINDAATKPFYGRLSGYSPDPFLSNLVDGWHFSNIPFAQCFMEREEAEEALKEGVDKLYA